MGVKLCVEPGCFNVTAGSRCTEHERAYQRKRNATPKRAAYRAHKRHPFPFGTACACCGTTADITRHHPIPLATGYLSFDAVPMCRRCNSSIADRIMEDHLCPMHGGVVAGG